MRGPRRVALTCVVACLACSKGELIEPSSGSQDQYGRALFREGKPISYRWSGSVWVAEVEGESFLAEGPSPEAAPSSEAFSAMRRRGPAAYSLSAFEALPVGSWPEAVAIGDVTGDDLPDVVMTTTFYFDAVNDYHVFVFPQLPGGALDTPTRYPYLANASRNGIVLRDLDEDGILDVVVGHATGVSVLLADGVGGLGPARVILDADADTLASMDVNRDCHADVISLGWSRGASILYGDGTGAFPRICPLATNASGYNDHEVEDLDDDGYADLAVMSGQVFATPDLSVHLHDLIDRFFEPRTHTVEFNTKGIGLGDVTGDGKHDVVLSRARNSPTWLWIFEQNASGQLDPPTTIDSYDIPEPVEVADLDGDCREDVAVAHGGWNRLGIYLQQPSGGLGAEDLYVIPYASHYAPQGMALGDFSSDGCADVAIADYNNGLVVLYGQGCVSGSCADPDPDGGACPGTLPDGCVVPADLGPLPDVGTPDLPLVDMGSPDSSPSDGSTSDDSSLPDGTPPDTGPSADTSAPADGGSPDSMSSMDGGERDGRIGASSADGCSCALGSRGAGVSPWLLAGFWVWAVRLRKKR